MLKPDCARRKSCQSAFGQGFDSPQLHHKSKNPNIIINGDTFGFLIFMSFYNLEITVVCSIFSASSKPCITSAMMRVAKINPELNASHSVMQDSSLVQSLIFSKVSFCFIVRIEFRSPSFLHVNLT